jgi:hypothetical protein
MADGIVALVYVDDSVLHTACICTYIGYMIAWYVGYTLAIVYID